MKNKFKDYLIIFLDFFSYAAFITIDIILLIMLFQKLSLFEAFKDFDNFVAFYSRMVFTSEFYLAVPLIIIFQIYYFCDVFIINRQIKSIENKYNYLLNEFLYEVENYKWFQNVDDNSIENRILFNDFEKFANKCMEYFYDNTDAYDFISNKEIIIIMKNINSRAGRKIHAEYVRITGRKEVYNIEGQTINLLVLCFIERVFGNADILSELLEIYKNGDFVNYVKGDYPCVFFETKNNPKRNND